MCWAVRACQKYRDAAAVAGERVLGANRTRGVVPQVVFFFASLKRAAQDVFAVCETLGLSLDNTM